MKVARGLTFLEIVISLSIFAVALVGLLQIVNTALNSSYRASQEIIGTNLASGLLAEIINKNFADPDNPTNPLGPDGTETRNGGVNAFDDVDDYNGYTESPPVDVSGNPMDGRTVDLVTLPNYFKFRRSVTVTYCDISGNNIVDVAGPTDYKHIKVTVTGPYLRSVIIHGVKEKAL